jgi:hypothetical protein
MTRHASCAPFLFLVAFGAAGTGCSDKDAALDSASPDTTEQGGGSDGVVWDDLRLESSVTLTSGFASGSGFYASGEDGEIYLRSEGSWMAQGVNSGEPLNGLWGYRDGEVNYAIAVGDGGTVARLDELGWVVSQELNTANMEAVASVDGSSHISVGWGGAYVSSNGSSWEFQSIGGNPQFNSVWSDGNTTVAVGQDGAIATTRGGDWTVENLPSRVALNGISGLSADDLWAVGESGTVLHKTSGDWEEVDIGTSATLWDVEVLSADAVFIVGNNGLAMRYDGAATTELITGVDNNLYDVTASSSGTIWAVGNRGATLRLQGNQ